MLYNSDFFMKALAFALCFLFSCSSAKASLEDDPLIEIRLAGVKNNNPLIDFRKSLITLAMNAAGKRYNLEQCDASMNGASDLRLAEIINKGGNCNILATSAGSDAARELKIIPFPIYLGGGGYRVLIANPQGLRDAYHIKTINDLKKHRIGSGIGWVDTKIMSDNGFSVVSAEYLNLFEMLKAGRFNYLTRSMFEASSELDAYGKNTDLALEKTILIHYPVDLFFYVPQNRDDIAKPMLDGLTKLYESGEYEKFLKQHYSTKDYISRVKPERRIIFELNNHRLSNEERNALIKFKLNWARDNHSLLTRPRQ